MKMLQKSVPAWAFIIALVACASVVIAAIMFTSPTATQKMKVKADYRLELYYASEIGTNTPTSWILVPSGGVEMDWGEFAEGESKSWYFKIKNVGNVGANVCWRKSGWTEEEGKWILEVDLAGTKTNEGVSKPLAVGAEITMKLALKEDLAQAGVVYAFGVFIENHDAPVP